MQPAYGAQTRPVLLFISSLHESNVSTLRHSSDPTLFTGSKVDVLEPMSSCIQMDPVTTGSDTAQIGMEPIPLRRMDQQVDVRTPEDDWTGMTSRAARRKLQNRLNQRAWRRRQLVAKQKDQRSAVPDAADGVDGKSDGHVARGEPARRSGTLCRMNPAEAEKTIDLFGLWAETHAMMGSPSVDLLLTLTRFNVFRALAGNAHSLGFGMSWLRPDAVSAFNTMTPNPPWEAPTALPSSPPPPSLRPSALQLSTAHHPWIDLLPFPALRDNILRRGESFDDTPICFDIVEFCHVSGDGGGTGLIVWGEPSDPRSWEASEGLLRKWGWLFSGCWELFEATNEWRARRGERGLLLSLVSPS